MGAGFHPIDFLLNDDQSHGGSAAAANPVSAPAFSLTKVLSSAAIVVAPLATWLVDAFTKTDFTSGQIVALTAAILGFLAVASSADVLARAIATAADSRAKAVMLLNTPLAAQLRSSDVDPKVTVLAVRGGGSNNSVLVAQNGSMSWVNENQVYYS